MKFKICVKRSFKAVAFEKKVLKLKLILGTIYMGIVMVALIGGGIL